MVEESGLLDQLKVWTSSSMCVVHMWVCACVFAHVCVYMCFLQIIKDFYLLGRGELYQVFIDLAQQMLKTLPTAVTEHGQCGRGALLPQMRAVIVGVFSYCLH